jgi:hypothetical protein
MSESIEVARVIPASAEVIYKAWLSGEEHGLMVGSTATYDPDDSFTAWDGYISGTTTEKQPYTRFVQQWRTTEFGADDPDSILEVLLAPEGGGTRVTLKHSRIPDGQSQSYASGWVEHYFDPMTNYFQSARSKLHQAGEALSEAGGAVSDAFAVAGASVQKTARQVGESAQEAARQVSKTAKKASSAVKKLVAKAKKTLAKRKKKKVAARKKKVAARKKKAAPKKKKGKSGKKRR